MNQLPNSVEILSFEPSLKSAEGNTVVTMVNIKGRGVATGKEYTSVNEMIWTFNKEGKVIRYDNKFDPSGLEAALTK